MKASFPWGADSAKWSFYSRDGHQAFCLNSKCNIFLRSVEKVQGHWSNPSPETWAGCPLTSDLILLCSTPSPMLMSWAICPATSSVSCLWTGEHTPLPSSSPAVGLPLRVLDQPQLSLLPQGWLNPSHVHLPACHQCLFFICSFSLWALPSHGPCLTSLQSLHAL